MDRITSGAEDIYDMFSEKMTKVVNGFNDAVSSNPQHTNNKNDTVDIGQIVTNTKNNQQMFSTNPELKSLDDLDLAYIQQRDKEIKNLHKDIVEINLMFKNIDELINDQSPIIDSISENITKSGDYVEGANEDLKQAKESQSNANKWIFLGVSATTITTVLATALLIILI